MMRVDYRKEMVGGNGGQWMMWGGIWTVDDGKNDGKLMMGTDNRNR